MQLFLEVVPIILKLFSKARGHLLFSNYSWNNLPKPIAVAPLEFEFGNEAICSALSICPTDPALAGMVE